MVVCSHCGRESRAADRFCQYCGQQLDPSNGHLVAAFAPHYVGASGEAAEWQGQLADAPAVSSSDSQPSQDVSHAPAQPQPSSHTARLLVRQVPDTTDGHADSAADAAGREYQLDNGDVAIGRAPSCEVVLDGDQLASRRHALLRHKGENYSIVDLGSSNGTYVNDLEIREATVLKDGDIITIGAHEIVFSTSPASPNASVPGAAIAAMPVAPLGETDPSASAVNAPLFSTPAVSSASDDHLIFAGADGVSPEAPVEDERAQPFDAASAESDAPVASGAVDADIQPVAAAESSAEQVPADVAGAADEGNSEAAAGGVAAGLTGAAAAPSNLEGLRAQLAEISAALARKADEEARTADRLRATLAEARDRLAALSGQRVMPVEHAGVEDAPAPSANVSELVSVARQAAENPRHLDYLTSLASHAGEIAAVLEVLEARHASAQPSGSNADVLDALDEVRARLDDALKQH